MRQEEEVGEGGGEGKKYKEGVREERKRRDGLKRKKREDRKGKGWGGEKGEGGGGKREKKRDRGGRK